jgi:hypothetical protein
MILANTLPSSSNRCAPVDCVSELVFGQAKSKARTMECRFVLLSALLDGYRVHLVLLFGFGLEPHNLLRQQTPILSYIASKHPPIAFKDAISQFEHGSILCSAKSCLSSLLAASRDLCNGSAVYLNCEGRVESMHESERYGGSESGYDETSKMHWERLHIDEYGVSCLYR